MTNKSGIERATIKRFFNDINDPSVGKIVFVSESSGEKVYLSSMGSKSYQDFKRDFRESTSRAVGKTGEYKIEIASGYRNGLTGFKFSDFGMADDFDSSSKTIVIRESIVKNVPEKPDSKKKS